MPASDTSATRLPSAKRAQQARLRGILRGIAVGHGRNGNAVGAGEPGEDTRVLAGDQVGGAQHVERAQGDVAQVADRSRDDMQAGRQRVLIRRHAAGGLPWASPPLACESSLPSICTRPPEYAADASPLLALAAVAFLLGACTETPSLACPRRRRSPPDRSGRLADHALPARRASRCCCRSAAAAAPIGQRCSRRPSWRCSTPAPRTWRSPPMTPAKTAKRGRGLQARAGRRLRADPGTAVRRLGHRAGAAASHEPYQHHRLLQRREASPSPASG